MLTRLDTELLQAAGDCLPRPHPNCYWLVRGRVLAGEYPGVRDPAALRQRVDALLDAGVTHCFDLTHELESLPAYAATLERAGAARGVATRTQRFSVADFGVPSVNGMRTTLAAIDEALLGGGVAYLHCRAGIGRTGTAAGCLLVEQGLSGEAALALINFKWQVVAKRDVAPHSPETADQRDFIARWGQLRLG
jgi:atypical dual specificity phosphatase